MRSYIRKVKTKSGAIAVQIEHKEGRRRVGITHIGSAHNEEELKLYCAVAYEKLHEGQYVLDLEAKTEPGLRLKAAID